jgi:maleate isomerase
MKGAARKEGTTAFDRVRVPWTPTPIETRLRFGLIALATDHTSETELQAMLPASDADLLVTRVRYSGHCDLASLRAMADELAAASALLLPGSSLQAIAWGCTSGTAAIGYGRVAEAIRSQHPDVPVTTPLSAATAAFHALGVGRVAVVTPYVHEVNEMIVDALELGGIRVPRLATFELETDAEMWSVPPEAVERAVLDMDRSGTDAVFVSCTALRSSLAIAPLERRLGVPVVASNQAMLWHMLQAGGHVRAVRGFGRLLEEPELRVAG